MPCSASVPALLTREIHKVRSNRHGRKNAIGSDAGSSDHQRLRIVLVSSRHLAGCSPLRGSIPPIVEKAARRDHRHSATTADLKERINALIHPPCSPRKSSAPNHNDVVSVVRGGEESRNTAQLDTEKQTHNAADANAIVRGASDSRETKPLHALLIVIRGRPADEQCPGPNRQSRRGYPIAAIPAAYQVSAVERIPFREYSRRLACGPAGLNLFRCFKICFITTLAGGTSSLPIIKTILV